MRISDILYLLGKSNDIPDKYIKSFKLDSRSITTGDVFIDVSGNIDYIIDSINNGAMLVISTIKYDNNICICVDDISYALQILVNSWVSYVNIPIIAVTGSCGKTTTKELIYDVLSTKYKVLKNKDNYNNIFGLSKTLFELNKSYDVCVVELGMNHRGEINILSRMCNPDIGIITNIGSSHIGNLNGKKNIFISKCEILNGMKDSLLLINGDDRYLNKVKYCNTIKVGLKRRNHFKCTNLRIEDGYLYFNVEDAIYKFCIPNKKYIYSLLMSIYIGLLYNIDERDMKNVFLNYKAIKGRCSINYVDNYILIDDTYNASLESILSGLNMVNTYNKESIIVLGDIKEIDGYEKKIYKKLNKALKRFDNVILFGECSKYLKGYKAFNNLDDLYSYIYNLDKNNKVLYLKASRKMNLDYVVDKLLINNSK